MAGPIVGRGASADVLAWGEGRVVKLFHARYAYAVEMELERARAVQALGAPCPLVFEKVEHEGRPGIVFERVDGPLLLDALQDGSHAAIERVAERLAELHLALHALQVPADSPLPRLTEWVGRYLASLPAGPRERAEAELARLPADTGLCHVDFHPRNVIEAPGRAVVVDWVNACSGPLALDVGRSYVLLAWQGATRREGSRQRVRLALAERYRTLMTRHVASEDFARGLSFAADALLRAEPQNPYAAELQAAIPWR
jgi:aminoglycoside phosphotransferase (APT) family kinase protein